MDIADKRVETKILLTGFVVAGMAISWFALLNSNTIPFLRREDTLTCMLFLGGLAAVFFAMPGWALWAILADKPWGWILALLRAAVFPGVILLVIPIGFCDGDHFALGPFLIHLGAEACFLVGGVAALLTRPKLQGSSRVSQNIPESAAIPTNSQVHNTVSEKTRGRSRVTVGCYLLFLAAFLMVLVFISDSGNLHLLRELRQLWRNFWVFFAWIILPLGWLIFSQIVQAALCSGRRWAPFWAYIRGLSAIPALVILASLAPTALLVLLFSLKSQPFFGIGSMLAYLSAVSAEILFLSGGIGVWRTRHTFHRRGETNV